MITQTINISESNLPISQLIETIETGAEIILTKSDKPVAKISKISEIKKNIHFGVLKGKVKISSDFDDPLPETILSEFEGNACDF
ncbi:MAG: type II toxin-antitoxin system prevent-host-death family antitoxin [Thermodesulfobacteriota bacterium]|nr:type II toxin-antitoxin system prevent-host-death family antitoxin [Thermodesulfobacteriota bacterium]